ncbi:phosphotransferase enzyme family protein [Neobacillus kokaensis]|uniref:Aminoglycoside phosphotransferase n=1 Tax=Neobacillus kokaensis TaxID=2759023 RepID=A0ABQ3N656_9BACI|nr:phosphotransferase [Neobacillus kokaensis]GHH99012.1 aminoglycoside phosphotransferase [Neobacillus kokaensis]
MNDLSVDPLEKLLKKFQTIAGLAVHHFPFLSKPFVQLLNYSENATYFVNDDTGKKYILRISRPFYHSKAEIESELEWLQSIAKNTSINVALPYLGVNGSFVQEFYFENILYYFTLFAYLEGQAPDENHEDELVRQFETLGEMTAQLHIHSIEHYAEFQQLKRLEWNYDSILGMAPKWGRWQDGLAMTNERIKLFEQVSEKIRMRLNHFGKSTMKFGLIHSDLRSANLLVEDEQIKVIDFDDCGFGWFLFDLAASLSFIEHKPYIPKLITSWLTGYRKVRTLSKEDELEIPSFIMMRRLQLIAWIGSRDNETTRQLGSEFTADTVVLAQKYLADNWCLTP